MAWLREKKLLNLEKWWEIVNFNKKDHAEKNFLELLKL